MSTKALTQMTREEIIESAVKVLSKLIKKRLTVFGYAFLMLEKNMEECLLELVIGVQSIDMNRSMTIVSFIDTAVTWHRFPVWWDADRVSVNGCHADFEDFNGDAQRAKLWATLKALCLHST